MNFAPTEEQLMVRDMVRKFAETEIKPIAAELDHTHRHPEEICRKLGEMGIMGVSVPTEYGGAGMDNVTYVLAMIEISKACASCGVIVSVNNTLYGHPVKTFGHPEAGERSAVIYTLLGSCRRHGMNPFDYLRTCFEKALIQLPSGGP